MNKVIKFLISALVFSTASIAFGGPATDALGKCMIDSLSKDDKALIARFNILTLMAHPDVKPYFAEEEGKFSEVAAATGKLLSKLFTNTCRAKTIDALKADGTQAIAVAYSISGQQIGEYLYSNPAVSAAANESLKHMKSDELIGLINSIKK